MTQLAPKVIRIQIISVETYARSLYLEFAFWKTNRNLCVTKQLRADQPHHYGMSVTRICTR